MLSDPTDPLAGERWSGVLFRLGGRRFLAPVSLVAEVVAPPRDLTPVPGAPPWVLGIADLRGALVSVVDLVALAQGGRPTPGDADRLLLLRHDAPPCAVLVTEVIGIRHCAATARTAPPAGGLAVLAPFVQDAFDFAGEAVPVLALDRLLAAPLTGPGGV